ncbi:hypothetical protein [Nitrolancea hollandica]|uniref:Uncharacterized protein n=1 Tax=Nitrolancea hollandica Lb TaxID=1129897 RepID=I4EMD1_9BACT|nr:hypothetical protein [Nitrolancea hollandica]CCF85844.1 hypothetical protein NITHO_5930001 [Nitrolancea hollandica Lb]
MTETAEVNTSQLLPQPNAQRYTRAGRDWPKVDIKGKDAYSYRTLMNAAHEAGLIRVDAHLLHHDPENGAAFFVAYAYFNDGTVFVGHGDANQKNTNAGIGLHYFRMAETRAIARALALALNADANASDEFGGDDDGVVSPAPVKAVPRATAPTVSTAVDGDEQPVPCEKCGSLITPGGSWSVAKKVKFSMDKYGKVLCYPCRQQQ